ncbi:ribbon-helix-helix domain-containing protein [Candidatus Woesearchaeota archaeon]|nr:ribbon-helix-helix domain-containing protein [Candidatus Woesearchaeota archaeon]
MATKLVNVRLPETLIREGKKLTKSKGYANFQEFIKDSIRHQIAYLKKESWEHTLNRLYGSTKGKKHKPFTKEIRNKIAEEFSKNLDKQDELFKKFGL